MNAEQIVRRRVELINDGRYDALSEAMHDDVVTHYGSGEPVRGVPASAGQLFGFTAFIGINVTVEETLTDGDLVAARYTCRGRHMGEFVGIPATGAGVEFGGAGIHHIRDGRIDEVWVVDDLAALARQVSNPSWTRIGVAQGPPPANRGNRPGRQTAETNRNAVRRWIELLNLRRLDELAEVWAEDLVLHQGPDMPTVTGLASLRSLLALFFTGLSDLRVEIDKIVADNDAVVMRTTSTAVHSGELFGIAATGREVTYTGINTCHLADGKIVAEWFNDDMFALLQALQRPITPGEPS
jgi:steroid delta-isomerase-like uncharacterized protein